MKQQTIRYKVVEDKTIIWFKESNQYIIFENTTSNIIINLIKGKSINTIARELSKNIEAPEDKIIDFIKGIKKQFLDTHTSEDESKIDFNYTDIPNQFQFIKYYKINNAVFKISFLSEKELSLIHPKFSHLETTQIENHQYTFKVFSKLNSIILFVDNRFIGAWSNENVHYFQGKFSMEFIQKIHQKEENEWMGVFHASALSNSKKSILFLGDSGNGKSTSLALLQAHGFTCLADDFVPIDSNKKQVYSFPAAISIKKSSLETLLPIYPELKTTAEYNFKRLNKIVRFLKPNNTDYSKHLACKDLIFIKYQKDSELNFKKISKLHAFQKLVPDSWLSPQTDNVEQFLDWFSELNCYELFYSNNEEMINIVQKIFNNDV